jgi:hypothetical protein
MCEHADKCPFTIWAPGQRNQVENFAFTMYAAECEEGNEEQDDADDSS